MLRLSFPIKPLNLAFLCPFTYNLKDDIKTTKIIVLIDDKQCTKTIISCALSIEKGPGIVNYN
jgi:hypothetical protein